MKYNYKWLLSTIKSLGLEINFNYKEVYKLIRNKYAQNREIIDLLLIPDGMM
jgi:hypothetical protein